MIIIIRIWLSSLSSETNDQASICLSLPCQWSMSGLFIFICFCYLLKSLANNTSGISFYQISKVFLSFKRLLTPSTDKRERASERYPSSLHLQKKRCYTVGSGKSNFPHWVRIVNRDVIGTGCFAVNQHDAKEQLRQINRQTITSPKWFCWRWSLLRAVSAIQPFVFLIGITFSWIDE